jgi:anti-sigma factor RsiW
MNCTHCEERMSDYLEDALGATERGALELHIQSCAACCELMAGMSEVLAWARSFPSFAAPVWLPTRIIANTPRVVRETWLDTLAAIWKTLIEPRIAMAVFTAAIMIGWMGSALNISIDPVQVVRNPAVIYYGAGNLVNRAYDQAIRSYFRSPFILRIQTQIGSRIEQLREIS